MSTSNVTITDERQIDGDETNVIVRKVETPNGARLEIVEPASGRSSRLDPVELESVTWQEARFFTDILGTSRRPSLRITPEEFAGEGGFELSNEYGFVQLRFTDTPDGDRLLVHSVKTGHSTHLGAAELAALAGQEKTFFSSLLRTPLGPDIEGH